MRRASIDPLRLCGQLQSCEGSVRLRARRRCFGGCSNSSTQSKDAGSEAFDTMGLTAAATAAEIKSRNKELVKKHHPDANGGIAVRKNVLGL